MKLLKALALISIIAGGISWTALNINSMLTQVRVESRINEMMAETERTMRGLLLR